MRPRWALVMSVIVGVGAWPIAAAGQRPAEQLGVVDFPVSCASGQQGAFNRAMALLHHMTYPEARNAFRRIAGADSTCAMAQWGVAMTLFQPLWPTRPDADARREGWDAVRQAEELSSPSALERGLIEAAAAFFQDPASSDYWARIRRWEAAMEQVHSAFPDHPEVTALYALALLAVAPVDATSSSNAARAAKLLLAVYERNPEHPGAMHYLVHASDAPGRERNALEIVRKYETVAPANPHALHMPTHIYTRLGDWEGVIRGNLRAAAAALAHPAGDHGELVWDEFPHAEEYLIYAYLQRGADAAAAAQRERLHRTAALQPSFKTAFHLASTEARFALERWDWPAAARIIPRASTFLDWDRYPWPEAVSWFARGLGAAHEGALEDGRAASARVEELVGRAREAGEELFARNIELLHLELRAWLAHAAGAEDSGVALLRRAVDLEASTPKHAVTPAPTLPASELLGDLLLGQGHATDARDAYTKSLADYPGRFNSLLGAARAARLAGDTVAARDFYARLLTVADERSMRPALDEARAFLPAR